MNGDAPESPGTKPRRRRDVPREGVDEQYRVLIGRMAAGDAAALGVLYDTLAPRVHGLARFILGDPDDADDVVEETFWQAWQTADGYDGARGAPVAWILMIARTRAFDRCRAQQRRRRALAAAAYERPATTAPDKLDFHPGLASALQDLPAEQREVIELAFRDGLTHAEIASQTTQPLGTVKTRLRLAMDKLRQRLAPQPGIFADE